MKKDHKENCSSFFQRKKYIDVNGYAVMEDIVCNILGLDSFFFHSTNQTAIW
jgi:hypothetical protein